MRQNRNLHTHAVETFCGFSKSHTNEPQLFVLRSKDSPVSLLVLFYIYSASLISYSVRVTRRALILRLSSTGGVEFAVAGFAKRFALFSVDSLKMEK